MEAFLEHLWLELAAIALQVVLWRIVQWLRSRYYSPSGVVPAG
jgi:hypothetical protein